MNKRFVVLPVVMLAAGCSSGKEITPIQTAQFKPGISTEAEVIAKLGPPSIIGGAA